jgi:hypothetical protein
MLIDKPHSFLIFVVHWCRVARIFFSCVVSSEGKQINDKLTVKPNIIFDTNFQKDPHR